MRNLILAAFIFAGILATSCSKEPGRGGRTTLKGTLMVTYIEESDSTILGIEPLSDERVYIIYGNGSTNDDDVRSSYDGTFKFDFLHEGSYKLYAYSECTTCLTKREEVVIETEIPKKSDQVDIGILMITRYK
ncbi:hypothetical protein KFE98_20470 [bacterium SCSIO 12741]|nr:hypothetical protein KFE98_20470 [bacterium SCSIO 12741]